MPKRHGALSMKLFQDTMYDFCRFESGRFWYIQNLFMAVALMFISKKKHFKMWEVILLIVVQKCYYWLLICSLASIGIGFILAETEKLLDKKRLMICLYTGVIAAVVLCGFSYGWLNIPHALEEVAVEAMRYVLSTSVAVIGLCMDSLVPVQLGNVGRYIRKLSTVIYLSHMLFIGYTFDVAAAHGAMWGDKKFYIYSAGTVVMLSIVTGMALIIVSELKPFKILKKIY